MTDEELKSLVASLAVEGRETDRRLKETERILKENSEKTDRQMKETDRQMKETERGIDMVSKHIDRVSKHIDRVSEQINGVSKQMGGINENIGHHAEEFFQNIFADSKVFGGIKFDDIILNMAYKGKAGEVEFDIFLENGNSVALIEVKNRIHPDFVKKLAEERINRFHKCFPMYKGYDIYLGIAGFSFDKAVLEEAKKYGVGIIRQVGEGIEVNAKDLIAYH